MDYKGSYRSCDKSNALFASMFPDSNIARDFAMAKTKMRYTIVFGLAPYFSSQLIETIKDCKHYTVMFDESFNCTLHKQQMDVWIRYFDHNIELMRTRFLCCQFLDKTTARDLQLHLKSLLNQYDIEKLIQISMDGPPNNIKMQRDLANERSAEIPDAPSLINIGVCNLHVVHGAFCTGMKVTGWKFDDIFKAMYSFFKNTYKRRTDFVEVTGTGLLNFIVN